MRELYIVLSDEDDKKLGEIADACGMVNDLELAQNIIHEWLKDDSARLEHTEK